MDVAKLQSINISETQRRRSSGAFWIILLIVLGSAAGALYFANPWGEDSRDTKKETAASAAAPAATTPAGTPHDAASQAKTAPQLPSDSVLTLTGYIINRERIEISPRVINEVRWIGVKKGDRVKKGQVVVRLDDAEQKARLAELDGQIAVAEVSIERAKLAHARVLKLRATQNETQEREDETRLAVTSAEAQLKQLLGARAITQVHLDWTVIQSPIDGVVLEKLADPGELVTPQSFGGSRGPSTALLSVGDPGDLQVEIDINERDLSKITMNQHCRISPEAYPEKSYSGSVVEMAPEANRQKGTLQIKVQIKNPDHFLTPELNAKVEFLK